MVGGDKEGTDIKEQTDSSSQGPLHLWLYLCVNPSTFHPVICIDGKLVFGYECALGWGREGWVQELTALNTWGESSPGHLLTCPSY